MTQSEPEPEQELESGEITAAVHWLKDHMGQANEVKDKMASTAEEPTAVADILQKYPRLVDQGMMCYTNKCSMVQKKAVSTIPNICTYNL